MIDAIDKAAGLSPDDAIYKARRFRPEFVEGAELCRLSVLSPKDDQGLGPDLRTALALRMATLNADENLMQTYEAQLASLNPSSSLRALAKGSENLPQPLATLARHVDFVTLTPSQAEAADITRLEQAGFNNGQIVALSELIAYVNFETRVATGLRLLGLA